MPEPTDRSPHPLAITLAGKNHSGTALLVGIGSGRNLPPFLESDRLIIAVDENETRVAILAEQDDPRLSVLAIYNDRLPISDATIGVILVTHALQHGNWQKLQAMIAELKRVSAPGALLGLVFASTADARYGQGQYLGEQCYAPTEGDEIGVAHIYVDEKQVRSLLADGFHIESLEHVDADRIAGAWAHKNPNGLRHFFVQAVRS